MRRLAALTLLTFACNYGFEKQSSISKLRVLAVRAEPPEVVLAPGEQPPPVELTALAVDPSGAAVEVRYAVCTVPGLPAANLDCPGADGIALPSTDAVSAQLDPAAFGPMQEMSGPMQVAIGFQATAGNESLHGFAELTVRTSADGPAGRNPSVVSVQADGAEIETVHAGATVHLVPAADKDGVTFSFYATSGDLDSLRATAANPEVDWTAPATPGPVQLWIVARDGHGGVGWLARTVQVVP